MNRATDLDGATEAMAEHLAALEYSLLDPEIRADPDRLAELLSDDFVEFGSSGRVWTKATTIASLVAEDPGLSGVRTVTDLQVRQLADQAALVTYVVGRQSPGEPGVQTLRSSIWRREKGKWRMVFHQGTQRKGEVDR
jgi:hypothetical protein